MPMKMRELVCHILGGFLLAGIGASCRDGYLEVPDHLDDFASLPVLTGVEVTCRSGASEVHVIGVFDPDVWGSAHGGCLIGLAWMWTSVTWMAVLTGCS